MKERTVFPESVGEEHTPTRAKATRRCTIVSAVVNVLLSIFQILVGLVSGSQGLIADGIHTLSDLVSDFLVLWASHHGQKEPDQEHPFGHQRFENMAILALGGILLLVGIGMVASGVLKLQSPETIPVVGIAALWVAIAALAIKESLFRFLLYVAKRVRSSLLTANAWHARSDAASSLVVSIGIIGNLMGYPLLDPIAALVVGLMVGRAGLSFMWDAIHDLTDRAASQEQVARIEKELLATPGVDGLHELRTRKTGDMILVDVHLEVDGKLTVTEGHDIALDAATRVLANHPVLNIVTHVDPSDDVHPARSANIQSTADTAAAQPAV